SGPETAARAARGGQRDRSWREGYDGKRRGSNPKGVPAGTKCAPGASNARDPNRSAHCLPGVVMNLATAAVHGPYHCSDAGLALAVAAGVRRAFGVMMKRYNQLLYRTARSVLRDDADAEDAVQDAWLQAWRAM